jgi:hypothetical protein
MIIVFPLAIGIWFRWNHNMHVRILYLFFISPFMYFINLLLFGNLFCEIYITNLKTFFSFQLPKVLIKLHKNVQNNVIGRSASDNSSNFQLYYNKNSKIDHLSFFLVDGFGWIHPSFFLQC